ncbi:nuclear transport factor 2 family protein [Haloplanus salilacus]|uniref:nuclear transport factor 2 family protein n=1 Tax=Haloplanus salilacus TaxID=2949994 RepID=UPI0030D03AED
MNAEETIRDYYGALRRGDPLYPYFAERPNVVKFGVGERLVGYDAIEDGLRTQTRTTENWTVESRALRVVGDDDHAHFSDSVRMAWTDTTRDHEYDLSTRWSGSLERRGDDGDWLFVGMHVSTPYVDG